MKISKYLGGNGGFDLLTNKEQIFTESGVFVAPKTGKYLCVLVGGGSSGCAALYHGSSTSYGTLANGGRAGRLEVAIVEMQEGESAEIFVGLGGVCDTVTESGNYTASVGGDTALETTSFKIVAAGGGINYAHYNEDYIYKYYGNFLGEETGSGHHLTDDDYSNTADASDFIIGQDIDLKGHIFEVEMTYKTYEKDTLFNNPDRHGYGMGSQDSNYRAAASGGQNGINNRGGDGQAYYNQNAVGENGIGYGSGGGGAAVRMSASDSGYTAKGGDGGDGICAIRWFEE